MGGIRIRITVIAMVAVAVVLIVMSYALLTSQRRILTNNLEEVVGATSAAIQRDYVAGTLDRPLSIQADEDAIAQVVGPSGEVVTATANFANQPSLPSPGDGQTRHHSVELSTEPTRFLLLSRSVDGVVIHVATPLDDVEESVSALRTGLWITIPLVVLALGGLAWWLVGRTLRPVQAITGQVAEITGSNLHRRVPSPNTNDEIAGLASTMNAMLDRLEDSAERQRRFVDDASHELRSPLTRMHAELEVDLQHPGTADTAATQRSVLEEVIRLEELVRDLLELARIDSGATAPVREQVDLDDLALREAGRLRAMTALTVDTSEVSGAQVLGDAAQLSRALRNLADNAARHARTSVAFATNEIGDTAELVVTDDGPGIPEGERLRVFERFARLDDARNSASGGTGLGLAITREIVLSHGGSIRIEDTGSGGARFVLTVPLDRARR